MMPLWGIAIAVAAAGLIGGFTSAYYIQNRSLLGERQDPVEGVSPTTTREAVASYLGNGFLGAVAGCVSWAAYGAYSAANIFTEGELTFVTLAGAFFIGMGGTKWLQSERDKGRWQATAYQVAVTRPSPELQATLSLASSDQAIEIARAAHARESGGPEVQEPRSGSGGQGRPGGQGAGGRPGGQGGPR